MEDLLVLIIQFIFEVLLQALAELPWDWLVKTRAAGSKEGSRTGAWIFLSLVAGAGVGGLSLLVFPTTLLHWGSARMANLLVAPTLSALVSLFFARRSVKRDAGSVSPRIRAACAACFTLMLALIRFAYATRPSL